MDLRPAVALRARCSWARSRSWRSGLGKLSGKHLCSEPTYSWNLNWLISGYRSLGLAQPGLKSVSKEMPSKLSFGNTWRTLSSKDLIWVSRAYPALVLRAADRLQVSEVYHFREEVVASCEVRVARLVLEDEFEGPVLRQEHRIEALWRVEHENGGAWRGLVSELADLHDHGFAALVDLHFPGFDQRAHLVPRDAVLQQLLLVEVALDVLRNERVGRGVLVQPDEADLHQLVAVHREAVVEGVLRREVLSDRLFAQPDRGAQELLLVQHAVAAALFPVHENLHGVFPLDQLCQVLGLAHRGDFLLELVFDRGDCVEVQLYSHHVPHVFEELADAPGPVHERAGGGLLLEEGQEQADDAHQVVRAQVAEEELHVFREF